MKIFYSIMSVLMLFASLGMKSKEDRKLCFAAFVVVTISALLYQFLPYILK